MSHLLDPAFRPARTLSGVLCRGLLLLGILCLTLPGWARQDEDPPARVGRVARVDGDVTLTLPPDGAQGPESVHRPLNWPITRGSRLSTDEASRVEVGVGRVRWRLGARSELLVRELDDESQRLELLRGSLALILPEEDDAREVEILLPGGWVRPTGSGRVRLDVEPDERPSVTAFGSSVRVEYAGRRDRVRPGQRLRLDPSGVGHRDSEPFHDGFARWALDEVSDEVPDYLPSGMTGAEDLANVGRWEQSGEWGMVWHPTGVGADWAPYQRGQWRWVPPWGWTWIDEQPWGFAPFHYGRWVVYRNRWVWVPGEASVMPVYAPALVVWSDAPQPPRRHHHDRDGLDAGLSGYRWTPLAPNEIYQPAYRASPRYQEDLNRPHRPRDAYRRIIVSPSNPPGPEPDQWDRHDRRERHEFVPAPAAPQGGGGRTIVLPQAQQPAQMQPQQRFQPVAPVIQQPAGVMQAPQVAPQPVYQALPVAPIAPPVPQPVRPAPMPSAQMPAVAPQPVLPARPGAPVAVQAQAPVVQPAVPSARPAPISASAPAKPRSEERRRRHEEVRPEANR